MSESCAIKLVQRWTQTGSVTPATPVRRKPYALAKHEQLVRDLVAGQPDMTLDELHDRLAAAGIKVGRSSVHRYLEALELTRKKKTLRAAEQGRPDVAAARQAWREGQAELEPA